MAVKNMIRTIDRVALYIKAHARIKYYRGHNIHSPFAYSLMRNVFMKRKLNGAKTNHVYDILLSLGIARQYAIDIQNLHDYCEYDAHSFTNMVDYIETTQVRIIMPSCDNKLLNDFLDASHTKKQTIIVMSPRLNKGRLRICEKHASLLECMSIDKRGFFVYFFGQPFTKQHFKL